MPGDVVDMTQDGCNYCQSNIDVTKSPGQMLSNDNLTMSLEKVREVVAKNTSKYDCLVGITGGRDSGFLLDYVKNHLGLVPLAVYYDTGFVTDEAKFNMDRATSVQGVDFVTYKLNETFNKKITRGFFMNYGEFCSPCHQGHAYIVAMAAKMFNIPIYLRGIASKYDYNYIDSNYSGYYAKTEEEFNKKIASFAKEQNITKEDLRRNEDFLHIDAWRPKFLTVDLPDFYDVDSDYHTVNKKLKDLYDWKNPKGQFFHADCKINPILEYMKYRKHGYCGKNVQVSNLLKFGEITLQEGKELLVSEEVKALPPSTLDFMKYLDIDIETMNGVVEKFWTKKSA